VKEREWVVSRRLGEGTWRGQVPIEKKAASDLGVKGEAGRYLSRRRKNRRAFILTKFECGRCHAEEKRKGIIQKSAGEKALFDGDLGKKRERKAPARGETISRG